MFGYVLVHFDGALSRCEPVPVPDVFIALSLTHMTHNATDSIFCGVKTSFLALVLLFPYVIFVNGSSVAQLTDSPFRILFSDIFGDRDLALAIFEGPEMAHIDQQQIFIGLGCQKICGRGFLGWVINVDVLPLGNG